MSILFKAIERARKAQANYNEPTKIVNEEEASPYSYNENDFYEGPAFAKSEIIDSNYEDNIEYQSSYSSQEEMEGSFSNFLMFVMSLGLLTAMAVLTVGAFIFRDDIAKQFSGLGTLVASKDSETTTQVAKNSHKKAKLVSFSNNSNSQKEPGFTRENNSNYENLFAKNQNAENSFQTAGIKPVTTFSNNKNNSFNQQQIAQNNTPSQYDRMGYQFASNNQYGRHLPPVQQAPITYKRHNTAPMSTIKNEMQRNRFPVEAASPNTSGRFYMKMDNVPHVVPGSKPVEEISKTAKEIKQQELQRLYGTDQQLAQSTANNSISVVRRPGATVITSDADRKMVYPGRQTYSPREEITQDSNYYKQFENSPDFVQIAKADGLGHIPVSNARIKKARLVQRHDDTTSKSIRIYRENENTPSKDLVQVTTFSPNSKSALNRGYNSLVNGDYPKAITFYNEVLKNEPTNTYALLGKASALHKQGKKLEARLEYETILLRDPTNREALSNLLGLLSDDVPEDALRELLELAKQYPDYAPIAAQIGLLHANRGAYPQSLVYLERARRLAPSNLSYMYNYAIMLDNTERWEAAAEMYKELIYAAEKSHMGHNIPVAQVRKRLKFLTSAEEQQAEFDDEQQIGMLSINRMKRNDN